MNKEKREFYISRKDFDGLFIEKTVKVFEGKERKLSKKQLFIASNLKDNDEISLSTLNNWYFKSSDKGYFTLSDVITVNDLAVIQRQSIVSAKTGSGCQLFKDGQVAFLEVKRDKKNGAISISKSQFADCLCDVKVITKKEQEESLEKKEMKQLARLLEKYGEEAI